VAKATTEISEEYLRASANFHPTGMLDVLADAYAMAAETERFTQAMQVRYSRAAEYPLAPAVKELYAQVAAHQLRVAQAAAEIAPLIERLHAKEIERLRNPRTGERMWDVSANRDAT
jgi:hypothetical protein